MTVAYDLAVLDLHFAGANRCVTHVVVRCIAREGEDRGAAENAFACASPGETFTPFTELDEHTVLGWLSEAFEADLRDGARRALERRQADRAALTGAGLPWA